MFLPSPDCLLHHGITEFLLLSMSRKTLCCADMLRQTYHMVSFTEETRSVFTVSFSCLCLMLTLVRKFNFSVESSTEKLPASFQVNVQLALFGLEQRCPVKFQRLVGDILATTGCCGKMIFPQLAGEWFLTSGDFLFVLC